MLWAFISLQKLTLGGSTRDLKSLEQCARDRNAKDEYLPENHCSWMSEWEAATLKNYSVAPARADEHLEDSATFVLLNFNARIKAGSCIQTIMPPLGHP